MTDYSEMRRYAEQYRWQLITDEACRQRRRDERKRVLAFFGNLAAWTIMFMAVAFIILPAVMRIWRMP